MEIPHPLSRLHLRTLFLWRKGCQHLIFMLCKIVMQRLFMVTRHAGQSDWFKVCLLTKKPVLQIREVLQRDPDPRIHSIGFRIWGGILGGNPDRSLKSFPPCYSQTPLLTDCTLPTFYFLDLRFLQATAGRGGGGLLG